MLLYLDSSLYDVLRTTALDDQGRYQLLLKNTTITGLPENDRAVIVFEYLFMNLK
jgi:hypothetical protein